MKENILKDEELKNAINNLVIPEGNELHTSEYQYICDNNEKFSDKIAAAYNIGYCKCRSQECHTVEIDQILTDLEYINDLLLVMNVGTGQEKDKTVSNAIYAVWKQYREIEQRLKELVA